MLPCGAATLLICCPVNQQALEGRLNSLYQPHMLPSHFMSACALQPMQSEPTPELWKVDIVLTGQRRLC
jgi:hypothetical protein